MKWADSGTNTLWRRDAANAAWINEGVLFQRAVPSMTIEQINALSADEGPFICSNSGGLVYLWDAGSSKYEPVSATDTTIGVARFATAAEAADGSMQGVTINPLALKTAINGLPKYGSVYSYPTRSLGVTYTNTTGKTIVVMVTVSTAQPTVGVSLYVGGTLVVQNRLVGNDSAITLTACATMVVPPGATYKAATTDSNGGILTWAELV